MKQGGEICVQDMEKCEEQHEMKQNGEDAKSYEVMEGKGSVIRSIMVKDEQNEVRKVMREVKGKGR